MDSLTNFKGKTLYQTDFSNDWSKTSSLGKARNNDDFTISGQLGGTVGDSWDSVDRVKFSVFESLNLNLNLDPQTIVEVVKFDSSGNASVVGSTEYGSNLQLQLDPGQYGLSLFVEGDLINYSISGQFNACRFADPCGIA